MDFRMLGPLAVQADGVPLPLRGRHHPKLLAILLDEANRVVPVDRLIAGLWDGPPPESARQQIQNVVAGLRRQLGPGAERLRTVGQGYVLDVEPHELDLLRCREHEAEAHRLREKGRIGAAAAALEAALREWRGSALTGLEGRIVETTARRLNEYRLNLQEERIDLEIELGADDALVAELRQLAAAHPLRQRFTEQLMLALHRTGRTPEALQLYVDFSERLGESLGIDPGRSLRELHTAILRDDSDPAPEPPGRPALLPSDVAVFTGRREHLEALDALLDGDSAQNLSVVTGTGGVGKTSLAVRWAHRVADRFPDGQLFVDLRGFDAQRSPLAPENAVLLLLDALGVGHQRIPAEPEARFGLYRSLLADRRTLVLLDNAADAAQARPLIPGGRGNVTLVTSRNPLYGLIAAQGARALPVAELSFDEARAMVERRLGKARVAAEPEAVEGIIERCARLPLALAVAAARAAVHPGSSLASLERELRESTGLDSFAGDDAATDIRHVFACSYNALSVEAAKLFRFLGLHPGPDATAPVAASLAAATVEEAHRALRELADAHLLTEHAPGRYTFHDLLRAYAAELATGTVDETERATATRRMLDHYAHNGFRASRLLRPEREPIILEPATPGVVPEPLADFDQALAWTVAESRTLLSSLELAAETGADRIVWQLAWAFNEFSYRQGHSHDGLAAQRAALAAARRSGDVSGQIYSLRMLAAELERLDDRARAMDDLEEALDLCDRTGERLPRAQIYLSIGELHGREHRFDEAVRFGRMALDIARELGHVAYEARSLNFVGWFLAEAGRFEEALPCCERALALYMEVGARIGQSTVWESLGYIHQRQGRLRLALDCFQRTREQGAAAGSRRTEAEALNRMGDVRRDLGDHSAAVDTWRRALAIADELGSVAFAATIREKLTGLDG